MMLDIPYFIKQVLREQQRVSVPGLGTLFTNFHSAHINADKTAVYPPRVSLDFDESNDSEGNLLEYIKDYGNFSKKEITKAISDYSNSIMDALVKKDVAAIGDLGTLFRDSTEDKLRFEPSNKSFTAGYDMLRNVSIKPVQRITTESVDHVVTTEAVVTTESSDKPWWIPIMAGILVSLIYILFRMGCNAQEQGPQQFDEGQEVIGVVDSTNLDGDNLSEVNYDEVDAIISEENNEVRDDSNAIASDIDTGYGRGEAPVEFVIPASGNCIIITGTFKRTTNITKMVSLIERNGYQSVTLNKNGSTRVGIKFQCEDINLVDYIQVVREKIEPKAWYLDPELHVDY